MATEIMAPVILDINSRLTDLERKEANSRFSSVYGEKFSSHKDLVSMLHQCVKENKINPINMLLLLEGLTSAPEKRNEIRGIVERFKLEQSSAIKEWEKYQPSEFVGRDIGWLGNILESHDCVVLWGASGVGKTKLAYTYMKSRDYVDCKVVDLRSIKSMELIYVETLKQFGKLVSIKEVSQGLVAKVIKIYVMSRRSLLLLDNADDFVHYPGEGVDLTSKFASLVKSILEVSSNHNVQVIITSREQSEHPDAGVLHQEQLMSLRTEDASDIIKSRMLHEKDKDSKQTNERVMEAVEQCKRLPLNLKVLAAALQEQGVTLESLLLELKKKAQEWKILKQKERVELPEEDFYTYGVLTSRFEQLSDTLQLACVAFSLFTRTFSLKSVAAVLSDCEESKIHMIIDHLKRINFVNEENESVYDMHPKVRETLISKITSKRVINEYYVKAKQNFITYYREQLINISKLVDDDYLKAYDLYMESSSDFNFIFGEEDNEFILADNFDDNQNIVSLLHHMMKPDERLKLFKNFADTAFKRGKFLQGTQHLCHEAMANSFYNAVETFKFLLLRVQHMLETLREECTSRSRKTQFDHLSGLYHYVRGEVLYQMARVNFSLSDCETAKESLEKSIDIRERLEPGGSTDIVRSYINLGNIYNITEDIHKRNKNFDKTEPLLEKALDVYNKALKLRKNLSPSGLHVDLPQIQNNIGTIWNERGLLLQMRGLGFGIISQNRKALECFREAEKCFKQSLETEKKLKLDGLYETSVKLVNMGDVQRYIKKFEEAIESLSEALELRRILKGDHEATVIVLYRLGTVSMEMRKFKEAAGYYREAFEMDERLPKDFHSALRKEIRQYLISAYEKWGRQERREESRRIKGEREELEKRIKELEEKEKEGQGSADQAKGVATHLKSKVGELDFQTSMPACEKYVDGEFDKMGGHVSFKYISVYLTIPRNLTEDTQPLRIYRVKEEDVKMNLIDSEFLVSDIIRVDSKFLVDLKNPAILEIRCDVLHSRIEKSVEIFMLEYDPMSKQWIDVERIALKRKRFYWYNESDYVPIIEGWINRFSMFAAVARPKKVSFSVPPSGLVWRPAEDGRVSLAFPSGCFDDNGDTSCIVKVAYPEPGVVKLAREERDLLLSPSIIFHAKDIAKPITVSLPLIESDEKPKKEIFLKILKKEDNYKAEFEIEDKNPMFKSEDYSIVEVGVSESNWMMAVWSSVELDDKALKWIGDRMFRHAHYNVDVFKRTAVDDSIMVGVACTPVKTNDLHWQERLKNLRASGYEYVNSARAADRLDYGALIQIVLEGQYVIAKPDKDSFRFNSRNFSPTPFVLRESPQKGNGGLMRFHKEESKTELCSIPYHKDFRLVSDNDAELASQKRNKPLRFLGMKLENCDLECLHVHPSLFRNNLYKAGLDEGFIEELKLSFEKHPQSVMVAQVLEEITKLFVTDGLAKNWFSVIETSVHPDSLRKSLISVMKILNDRLIGRDWKKIEAEIESGNETTGFLENLTSRLQEAHREPKLDFKGAMKEFVCKKHTLMDLVRTVLLIQRDGYLDETCNVLDKIGRIVDDWMPHIYD